MHQFPAKAARSAAAGHHGRPRRPRLDGAALQADVIVMATGTWTVSLFARHLRRVFEVVRQDVVMVAPPSGSPAYDSMHFP